MRDLNFEINSTPESQKNLCPPQVHKHLFQLSRNKLKVRQQTQCKQHRKPNLLLPNWLDHRFRHAKLFAILW